MIMDERIPGYINFQHLSDIHLNKWFLYLCVMLWVSYTNVECAPPSFQGSFAGYTEVPHSLIYANVSHIDLSGNRITTLGNEEFSNYTSLAIFDMNDGILSRIHDQAFLDTEISYLSLKFNHLDEFPKVTIISDTLQNLDLTANFIKIVPQNLLSPLVNLTRLILHANQISDIRPRMFSTNQNLEVLSLTWNNINEVPEDAFAGLSRLKDFSLGFNNISEFPAKVLEPLVALDILGLSGNPIRAWPDLTCVSGIRLEASGVESFLAPPYYIPPSVCGVSVAIFSHVPSAELPVFNCQENETSLYALHLHQRNMDDSTDFFLIQTVYVSGNLRLLGMSSNSFRTFPNIPNSIREHLYHLDINNCKIEIIDPSLLEEYNMLNSLDLSGNKLVTLPTQLFTIANHLYVSYMKSLDFDQSLWEEYLCEASDGKLSNLYLSESMDRIQQFPDVSHLVCNRKFTLTISITGVSFSLSVLHTIHYTYCSILII